MKRRTIEQVYDEVGYMRKEMAGLPTRFYQLESSLAHFFEEFADLLDNHDQHDNIEDVEAAKDLLGEAAKSLESVLKRLEHGND